MQMVALSQFSLFLSILAVAVHSSPTNLDSLASQRKFSIQQVGVEKTTKSVFHEIRSTYWKYGWDAPEEIEAGVQAVERKVANDEVLPPEGTSGSVVAKSIRGDLEYLINVQVGQHDLMLDLDTGSSDLWVMSTLLGAAQRNNKPANRLYNPANARPMEGSSWNIRYGDMSSASGKVFVDKVSIGSLEVRAQAVEAATTMSSSFTKGGSMDGLMGLGATRLNRIRPQAQPTWFENIRPKLAEPVFVSLLKRHAAGSYDFGFIDKTKYKGEIAWQTVKDAKGFWDFKVEGFAVGNGPVQSINVTAVADTGSSLWYAPPAMAEGFWKNVPGASYNAARGGYTVPCNAQIPNIRVILTGGHSITVPGPNLNYQSMGSTCFGGLQRNTGMPMSIFGDTFLKGLYVVFEHKTGSSPRIGLANGNF